MDFAVSFFIEALRSPNHKKMRFIFALGCSIQNFSFPIHFRLFGPVSIQPHHNCQAKLKVLWASESITKPYIEGDLLKLHWKMGQQNPFLKRHLVVIWWIPELFHSSPELWRRRRHHQDRDCVPAHLWDWAVVVVILVVVEETNSQIH